MGEAEQHGAPTRLSLSSYTGPRAAEEPFTIPSPTRLRRTLTLHLQVNVQTIPPTAALLSALPTGRDCHTPQPYQLPCLEEAALARMRAPPNPSGAGGSASGDEDSDDEATSAAAAVAPGAFPGTSASPSPSPYY